MADYTSDQQSWARHRWILQAPTNIAEVGKALSAAKRAAEEIGINTDCDDWLTIDPSDDQIIMWFDVRTIVS